MQDTREAVIKIVAMPSDTNPEGNIFGGWILSQIDLAGMIEARKLSPERVVTISIKEVVFKEPVFVGDLISCYADIISVGNTSITVKVEVMAGRYDKESNSRISKHVTTAEVTYVAVDMLGNKKVIDNNIKMAFGF